jgi:hypothetical protein
MDLEVDFLEFFTDTTSTRTDDFLSVHPSPWDEEQVIDPEPYSADPEYLRCVCKVCKKNTVDVCQQSSTRRKRRKVDVEVVPATQLVCAECLSLTAEQVSALHDLPDKTVLLLKRAQAKRRTEESQAVLRLKQEEEQVLANAGVLPPQEQKRLKQMMRNRLSAQHSRDRKKAYTQELEVEISALKQENSQLRDKVLTLEQENARLRGHSARTAFTIDEHLPRVGAISLGVGALFTVCFIASLYTPVPTVSLRPMGRHLLSVTSGPEHRDFRDSLALALPDQQML